MGYHAAEYFGPSQSTFLASRGIGGRGGGGVGGTGALSPEDLLVVWRYRLGLRRKGAMLQLARVGMGGGGGSDQRLALCPRRTA